MIGIAIVVVVVIVAAFVVARATGAPSHDRDWIEAQSRLPRTERDGDVVTITNVRNFRWRTDDDYDARWETRSYDLSQIRRVWFGLAPFGGRWRGPAHAFLSFEFADSQFVVISVEARREKGESYGALAGLLNRFEVIYVIGDERDVIGLRTHVWQDPVRLYPIATTPDRVRAVFLALLDRADEVHDRPEFYNTFIHNCLSALLHAANAARVEPIRFGIDVMLPGYSDRRLHRLGLMDTRLTLASARDAFLVDATGVSLTDEDFSIRIRDRFPR